MGRGRAKGVAASARSGTLAVAALLVLSVGGCGSDPSGERVTPGQPVTADLGTTTESTAATTSTATTTTASTTTAATTTAATTTTTVTTTTAPPATASAAATIEWGQPTVVENVDFGLGSSSAASPLGISTIRWTGREGAPLATDVWFSGDAITWDPVRVIDGVRLFSIVAGGPGFVAVGNEDTDVLGPPTLVGDLPRTLPAVWTSTDGLTWSPAPRIDNGPFPFGGMHDVAATSSGFVSVGEAVDAAGLERPAAWTSPDGLVWTVQPGDPFGTIDEGFGMSVAAGTGGVVAIVITWQEHGYGSILAWWSPDGVQWERAPDIESFGANRGSPNGVVAFGSGFVMVGFDWLSPGSGRPLVWRSVDGRTWNDPAPLPTIGHSFLSGLATDGSLLVVVGDNLDFSPDASPATGGATIWMSDDAEHWVQVSPDTLHGDALLDRSIAQSAVHFDDEWVVLGRTWEHGDGHGRPIVWHGRS